MRASTRLALVVFGVFAIVLVVLFMTPSSYYTASQNNQTGVVTPYPTAVSIFCASWINLNKSVTPV